MRDLPNLDLMRSIAVALVVLDHTCIFTGHAFVHGYPMAWVGVFGVYLFFIHTALVLMWSLERQPHVMNFYIRRVFRIYPLAIAAILITLAFKVPISDISQNLTAFPHFSAKVILTNILLLQDVIWAHNIVGVLWSLPLEVQMYVLLPALFLLANREKRIWQILVFWVLAVLVGRIFIPKVGNHLVTVIPDFLPGVIAYIAYSKYRARFPAWTFVAFLALLLAIFMQKPGVAISWPLMLCLGWMLPLFRSFRMKAIHHAAHVIAKYSYGIYLFHLFGIYVGFRILTGHSRWLQLAVELLITAAASVLGYHLLEEPLIRMGSRIARANDRRESARALTA